MDPLLNDQPAWYCVRTKPCQEDYAEEHLGQQGIEVYSPRIRMRKTIRRKLCTVNRPMFPGYLFGRFAYCDCARCVGYSLGVLRIVSFGNRPAIVDDDIIAEIRLHANEQGIIILEPPPIRRGDPVTITEGPFRGFEAIFERDLSDRDRVLILLSELEMRARVEIDRAWIRAS